MSFEKFTHHGHSARIAGGRPTCSIRRGGQFGFNSGARREFGLKDGYAVFYYDSANKVIGIQIVDNKDEEGTVRLRVRGSNIYLFGGSFLRYHNIPIPAKVARYNAVWSDEHGMILVDLKRKIPNANSKRREIFDEYNTR